MSEGLLIFFIILTIAIAILAIVIVSVAIYMQNKHIKSIEKFNQDHDTEFKKQLEEANQEFLKKLQNLSNTNYVVEDERKDLSSTFVKLRDSIKENCTSTMNDIGACRLAVYLFHNGITSIHGIKFFKTSCICEKVSSGTGIRERSIEHSNIPINLFDDMIDNLLENGKYIIINGDEVRNTNNRIFVSGSRIKYSQAVAIFDTENNILGFVLAEMDHKYDRECAMKEKERIDILVNQLVPTLSYSEYLHSAIK
jgi:hypothetical protein